MIVKTDSQMTMEHQSGGGWSILERLRSSPEETSFESETDRIAVVLKSWNRLVNNNN